MRLAPDGGAEIALPFTGLGTQVDVVVDTTGNVYVVDSANPTQVWKLSPGAATPTELPFAGLDDSSTAAAVDAAGNLYITDHQADRDHPGAIRQQILKLIPGVTAPVPLTFTDLGMASGIAVDSGDNVYVTDTFNNRVLKLAPGAAGSNPLPFTGLKNPWGVAVDAAGNVYVADSGNDRVLKLPAQ